MINNDKINDNNNNNNNNNDKTNDNNKTKDSSIRPPRPIREVINKVRLTNTISPVKFDLSNRNKFLLELRELYLYSNQRIMTFPKSQRKNSGIGNDIFSRVTKCMELARRAIDFNPRVDREAELRELSIQLKTVEEIVITACTGRIISFKQRETWLKRLVRIDDMTIGMAMWLQDEAKKSKNKNNYN